MSELVKNRSEILFLYDVTDANPNGDPVDENKPRIDEETGVNIVTDVRLKRTVRDYFLSLIENDDNRLKGQDIFVKERRDEEGFLYDAKARAKEFLSKEGKFHEMRNFIKEDICNKCIDIRLFGGVIPLDLKIKKLTKKETIEIEEKEKSGTVTLTGPVQFKFGRSLHKVDGPIFVKGTGAFADKYDDKNKKLQFTFREEYILPYSLIGFYGIVNENAAKETELKISDIELLLEGLWNGTKNLITRTKVGQVPRLLIQVIYKESNFHIGELDKRLSLKSEINDEKRIRDITDVKIDITNLTKTLVDCKDKIEKIRLKIDERISFIKDGEEVSLKDALSGLPIENISF